MRKDYNTDITPEVREKMKKNLVYISIFSIVMLFAGFTSGYIVSMGDTFWVKFPLPTPFWISTAIIICSSLFIQLGITFAKKEKYALSKLFVVLTFVFGVLFVYFQFKGYGKLIENGSHFTGKNFMTVEGRYGSAGEEGRYDGYYEIKYKGKFIALDGNDYVINGKKLSKSQFSDVKKFMSQFEKYDFNKKLTISNYGKDYILYYKQNELSLINGNLALPDSTELQYTDLDRLKKLAINIKDERGDFMMKGKIGKDFHVYFKGQELEYINRRWGANGKEFKEYLQTKPMETSDVASSYLYIITFLHLLHIIATLFYMFKMVRFSLAGKFTKDDTLSLRLGAIFWHFLGILWIYLLLFLMYIH